MRNRAEELLTRTHQSREEKVKQIRTKSDILRTSSPTDGSLKSRYLPQVLRMYFIEGMGYHTIGKQIPASDSSIAGWIRTFARQYGSKSEVMEAIIHLEENARGNTTASSVEHTLSIAIEENTIATTPLTAEEEIRKLKEELKYQRLRADAYDEMITVAEEQFNINIRKKAGAKQ